MNKSELDHVWHSVTSALEKEFWTRGWLSPHAAHIEKLEAALREIASTGRNFTPRIEGDLDVVLRMRQIARAALAPEQDK